MCHKPTNGLQQDAPTDSWLLLDQLVSAAHKTTDAVDATSRDVTNRARGVVAELRDRFSRNDHVSDDVLHERVRARIGSVVGHGGVEKHVEIKLWPKEQMALQQSARALKETLAKVKV